MENQTYFLQCATVCATVENTQNNAILQLTDSEWLLEKMERVMGIEPTYSAWKAEALPLSYTRLGEVVRR